MKSHLFLLHFLCGGYGSPNTKLKSRKLRWKAACLMATNGTHDVGGELITWLDADVDRLHV